jgi:hypothetical protein
MYKFRKKNNKKGNKMGRKLENSKKREGWDAVKSHFVNSSTFSLSGEFWS